MAADKPLLTGCIIKIFYDVRDQRYKERQLENESTYDYEF